MTANKNLSTLAAYKLWADTVFYAALAAWPECELQRTRPMLYDSIPGLLSHVYHMDIVWLSHLQGVQTNFTSRNPDSSLSFNSLRRRQELINNQLIEYVDTLSEEASEEPVHFSFIGGNKGTMSRFDIVQHQVNHASYHRGHVEGVFYQLAIEPPTTDLSVYLTHRDK